MNRTNINKKGFSQLTSIVLAVAVLFLLFFLLARSTTIVDEGTAGITCRLSFLEIKGDAFFGAIPVKVYESEPNCVPTQLLFREDGVYEMGILKKNFGEEPETTVMQEIAAAFLSCDKKFSARELNRVKGEDTCAICGQVQFIDVEEKLASQQIEEEERECEERYGGALRSHLHGEEEACLARIERQNREISGLHAFMENTIVGGETIRTGESETFAERFPDENGKLYHDTINITSGAKYYVYYLAENENSRKVGFTQIARGEQLNSQCSYIY